MTLSAESTAPPRPLTWLLGLSGSLVANAALLALVLLSLRAQDIPDQDRPKAELQVSSQSLPRSQARPAATEDTPLPDADARGDALSASGIPQSDARPLPPEGDPLTAQPAAGAQVAASAPTGQQLATTRPKTEPLPQAITAPAPLPAASAQIEAIAPARPAPEVSAALTPPSAPPVPATPPAADILAAETPQASAAQPSPVTPEPLAERPTANAAAALPAAPLAAQSIRADLAFPGDTSAGIDPQSLAAFQQFQDPGREGDALRDGLAGLLASLPCARVQLSFDPDSATLHLRGHLPEDSLRAPVLAALRAEMGEDIALADDMRLLPRPQCGALAGISDVGLPQSTDQITNPLLVGADSFARVLSYRGGERLFFDLTAPDYPAYVYVDYFDAAGAVLHLMPNSYVPLTEAAPKSRLRVGAKEEGDVGLQISVGPPYGQEIAVAFAASHPLFAPTAPRPLQEPAAPYLAALKQAVSAARQEHADFKGEWVYFLITTEAP
ncbi:DUF4384 domain-containing protein [Phaeobacter sp. HF9A]|uniref:DUF4384 domain-containing protein n=1 Tax=Phaeobacter sp. HF9A TaxID=2721561 RepID=UPI00142FF7C9|nr:DUF4384 domain-containing protein [Phaeobacter sp. HF9A]NIZ13168.1 DUF4384 domain-containing protein [Phaeobacter sp. HF9A]